MNKYRQSAGRRSSGRTSRTEQGQEQQTNREGAGPAESGELLLYPSDSPTVPALEGVGGLLGTLPRGFLSSPGGIFQPSGGSLLSLSWLSGKVSPGYDRPSLRFVKAVPAGDCDVGECWAPSCMDVLGLPACVQPLWYLSTRFLTHRSRN